MLMKQHTILRHFVLLSVSLLILFSLSSCKKNKEDMITEDTAMVTEKVYSPNMERLTSAVEEIKNVTGVNELDTLILIDGNDNKLFLVSAKNGLKILSTYVISASKYGYGAERGSNQTPWGVHVIDSKYGDGEPMGMCFYDRRPTGEIATIFSDTTNIEIDPVTSRIIWLKGLEEINRTSYWRFVYIHGTHEEGLLGTPQSKGCIRMSNKDVIELFALVNPGTYVNIIRPITDGTTEEE
ncbi:MAG: L,D-transpeptidase [Candidatus Neomarinimicrobiota bacterium]|nr:MAG: L,D-transpeptidase [Candidatus Neomarinimicrobiota bacterium]